MSIPAPSSAAPEDWLLPKVMFLSLVLITLELMVVVVPLTVKLPVITASLETLKLPTVAVPAAEIIPVVRRFPPCTLPVVLITPVIDAKLPVYVGKKAVTSELP